MDISAFRNKYPQYDDLSDDELARRLYAKHYAADMSRTDFDKKFLPATKVPAETSVPAARGVSGRAKDYGLATAAAGENVLSSMLEAPKLVLDSNDPDKSGSPTYLEDAKQMGAGLSEAAHGAFIDAYHTPEENRTKVINGLKNVFGGAANVVGRSASLMLGKDESLPDWADTNYLNRKLFSSDTVKATTDKLNDWQKIALHATSPEFQENITKQAVDQDENGDYHLGTGLSSADWWANQTANAVVQLPFMAGPAALAARVAYRDTIAAAAKVGYGMTVKEALATAAENDAPHSVALQYAHKQALKNAQRAAVITGGLTEGGISGAQDAQQTEDTINGIKEETLMHYAPYRELVDGGMSHEHARAVVAHDRALAVGISAAVVVGLTGAPLNHWIGQWATVGTKAGWLKRGLVGIGAEGAQEGGQSGAEQVIQNKAEQPITGKGTWDQVLNATLSGAAGVALVGGFGGIVGGHGGHMSENQLDKSEAVRAARDAYAKTEAGLNAAETAARDPTVPLKHADLVAAREAHKESTVQLAQAMLDSGHLDADTQKTVANALQEARKAGVTMPGDVAQSPIPEEVKGGTKELSSQEQAHYEVLDAIAKAEPVTAEQLHPLVAAGIAKVSTEGQPILLPEGRRQRKALEQRVVAQEQQSGEKPTDQAVPTATTAENQAATSAPAAENAAVIGQKTGQSATLSAKKRKPKVDVQAAVDTMIGRPVTQDELDAAETRVKVAEVGGKDTGLMRAALEKAQAEYHTRMTETKQVPFAPALAAAAAYKKANGVTSPAPNLLKRVNPARGKRIADAFEAMPHAPNDPKVKRAYAALTNETLAQWQQIKKTGLKVEFIKPGQADPYAASPRMAINDVRHNNHLWVFPTDSGFGTGPEAEAARKDNPMLEPTNEKVGSHKLVVNDVFRIVHDYFGHIQYGNGFRANGEEAAWRVHSAMYSREARAAMTSETRGQNSWVNYGPHGEANQTASGEKTVYAPQKIGLLPEEFHSEEGQTRAVLDKAGLSQAMHIYEVGHVAPYPLALTQEKRVSEIVGRMVQTGTHSSEDMLKVKTLLDRIGTRAEVGEQRGAKDKVYQQLRDADLEHAVHIYKLERQDDLPAGEGMKKERAVAAAVQQMVRQNGGTTQQIADLKTAIHNIENSVPVGQSRAEAGNERANNAPDLPAKRAKLLAKTKTLKFRHFSPANEAELTLDASRQGTGIPGAERHRAGEKVISLYGENGKPESQTAGMHEYHAEIPEHKMYNANEDHLGLAEKAKVPVGFTQDENGKLVPSQSQFDFGRYEQLIKKAGYVGYHMPEAQGNLRGQARVFGKLTVQNAKPPSTAAKIVAKPKNTVQMDVAHAIREVAGHLEPAEKAKLSRTAASKLVRLFSELPDKHEMAAVAIAGQAKRGWYKNSARAIVNVFGPESSRFAALLAAMSPQTSVQGNLKYAVAVWAAWDKAGKPTDRETITKIMKTAVPPGVAGVRDSGLLHAWVPNSIRALSSDSPDTLVLSGPKVDSFAANLRGEANRVTLDSWMANFALVDQRIFSGSLKAGGTDSGRRAGYLAYSARVRETAQHLSKMTGETWTPAEVQETIWSWAKTVYEHTSSFKGIATAAELVHDGDITDALINSTPDFATLFHNPENEKLLRDAGYGDRLNELTGQQGATGDGSQKTAALKGDSKRLGRAAERLDTLRSQREEAKAAGQETAAKVKGEPVPALQAPNGKPSKLSTEQHAQVRTPEFKTWFGDWEKHADKKGGAVGSIWSDPDVSKVVDPVTREPMVVYHASVASGFREFDPGMAGRKQKAVYFAADFDTARTYAGGRGLPEATLTPVGEEANPQNGYYPVFLNIRNPNESNFEGANWDGSRAGQYSVLKEVDGEQEQQYSENGKGFFNDREHAERLASKTGGTVEHAIEHHETTDSVVRDAHKYGNDGAIIRDAVDSGPIGDVYEPTDIFAVFKPEQIKSATQNTGGFDASNPDITAKRTVAPGGISVDNAQAAIKHVRDALGININVVQSQTELPASIQSTYTNRGIRIAGVFISDPTQPLGGTIHVVADHNASVAEALNTAYHETVGHAGLRAMLGDDYGQVMDKIVAGFPNEIRKMAKDYKRRIDNPGHHMAISDSQLLANRRYVAEEVVAHAAGDMLSEVGPTADRKKWERIIGIVRQALHAVGFLKRYSKGDLDALIYRSRDYIAKARKMDIQAHNVYKNKFNIAARAHLNTPAFTKWFGNSKVVDENGNPLRVYHGTTADFSAFRTVGEDTTKPHRNRAWMGKLGSWFAGESLHKGNYDEENAESMASSFVEPSRGTKPEDIVSTHNGAYQYKVGGNVVPAYLSIHNPLEFDGYDHLLEVVQDDFHEDQDAFRKFVESEGHDGLVIRNSMSDGDVDRDDWVAFHPTQIKSAVGNSGAYDVANPDMAAALKGRPLGAAPGNQHLDSFLNKIGSDKVSLKEKWREFKSTIADRTVMFWADHFRGIVRASNLAGVSLGDAGYFNARLSGNSGELVQRMMESGHPVWNDGAPDVAGGMGFLDILKPLGNDVNPWLAYMVARRAQRLSGEGRENLFTSDEINAALDLGRQHPEFNVVANRYAEFQKKVLDFAEEAGIINPDSRALWENQDYIPFYRMVKNGEVQQHAGGGTLGRVKNQIVKLTGGKANLGDPMENITRNWLALMDASLKAHAARTVVDGLNGTGLVSKSPIMNQVVPAHTVKDFIKANPVLVASLKSVGVDINKLTPPQLRGLQNQFAVPPPAEEGTISVWRGGEREHWAVHDSMLFNSLQGINKTAWGPLMELLRAPRRLITTTTTMVPQFLVKNIWRDMWHTYILGTHSGQTIVPVKSTILGTISVMKMDKAAQSMMAGGGGFAHGWIYGGDTAGGAAAIRRTLKAHHKGANAVLDSPLKLFRFYRKLQNASENANRVAIYQRSLDAGKSRSEALYEARDILDFNMHGASSAVQFLVQSVPFFNAFLQGIYRIGRGVTKKTAAGIFLRGSLMAAVSLAILARNWKDDRYKRLPDDQKSSYWHLWDVFSKGDHWQIPKPFETGVMFGTIPEIIGDAMLTNADEPDRFATAADMVAFSFAQQLNLAPQPAAIWPVVELANNKNSYTGAPILTQGDEGVLPEDQVGPRTSPTYRMIAQHMPGFAPEALRSPKQLEFLGRAYIGTVQDYVLLATDNIARRIAGDPTPPTTTSNDWPGIRDFRKTGPATHTKYMDTMFDIANKADKVYESMQKAMQAGTNEGDARAAQLQDENQQLLDVRNDFKSAASRVSDLKKQQLQIQLDPSMSPDDKRLQIDELQEQINDTAKDVWDLRPNGKLNTDVGVQLLTAPAAQRSQILRRNGMPATADLVNQSRALN